VSRPVQSFATVWQAVRWAGWSIAETCGHFHSTHEIASACGRKCAKRGRLTSRGRLSWRVACVSTEYGERAW
jgi:ribosomal protein L32